MKKTISVCAGVFAALLIFAGCSDFIKGPAGSASLPDGMGELAINLNGTNTRTLVPTSFYDDLDLYYVLTFKPAAGQSIIVQGWEGETVRLLSGNWTMDARGFVSSGDAGDNSKALAAVEDYPFTITAGQTTPINVALTPNTANMTQNGSGKLAISITLPTGASGEGKLLRLDGTEAHPGITLAAGATTEETLELASGFYYVTARAELDGKEKVIRELAQIYDNAVTTALIPEAAWNFTSSTATGISGFDIPGALPPVIDDAAGTISVFMPSGAINSLSPAIEFEGVMVSPASGETVDFSQPVEYTVYTEGGIEKTYTVTVSDTIEHIDTLRAYLLTLSSNDASTAYSIKLKLDFDTEWGTILSELETTEKYVELDLSKSSTELVAFNAGTVTTGKKFISALVLPDTMSEIVGINSGGVYDNTEMPFRYFTSLAAISGAGIKKVGPGAFKGFKASYTNAPFPNTTLSSFDFPQLEYIGDYAFYLCTGLSGELEIPAGVTTIGGNAFEQSGITSVVIPDTDSVRTLGLHAFAECPALTTVSIGNGVSSMYESFLGCPELESVSIGGGVGAIGGAFMGCPKLTSVTIGNGMAAIGLNAFMECTGLESVVIPDSVTTIERGAFRGCTALASVTIGSGVTTIGEGAFQDCAALTGISIPGSVETIGNQAFLNCTGLTGITIPDSVTAIGTEAFRSCTGLTSITIPASVTTDAVASFSDCTEVITVTFEGNQTILWVLRAFPDSNLSAVYNGSGTYIRISGTVSSGTWAKQP